MVLLRRILYVICLHVVSGLVESHFFQGLQDWQHAGWGPKLQTGPLWDGLDTIKISPTGSPWLTTGSYSVRTKVYPPG